MLSCCVLLSSREMEVFMVRVDKFDWPYNLSIEKKCYHVLMQAVGLLLAEIHQRNSAEWQLSSVAQQPETEAQ